MDLSSDHSLPGVKGKYSCIHTLSLLAHAFNQATISFCLVLFLKQMQVFVFFFFFNRLLTDPPSKSWATVLPSLGH